MAGIARVARNKHSNTGNYGNTMALPETIADTAQLDELLSEPTPAVIETMRRLKGDMILLGVAGKMGPTLARMAARASGAAGVERRIIGVARFSTPGVREQLEDWGVETIQCDLLDPAALDTLPGAPNVVYMAGMKFGATGNESQTWAMNCFLPGMVSRKYAQSRIVAFSTGNVYGLYPVAGGGAREEDPVNPDGEYAMSCLGRERIFEYFSRALGTPMALIRLNYACEMRYGVLLDMARKVWAGETVDLAMGHLNAIWQGDANAMALQCFDHVSSPPFVINVTGPETLPVREVCNALGGLLGTSPVLTGKEAADALLSDASKSHGLFGKPRVAAPQLLTWTADWLQRGGETLDKPTHFEVRDGKF